MTRNSEFATWKGSNWNDVFLGSVNAPDSHCGNTDGLPYTTIEKTPLIAEKPYITEKDGKFTLNVPNVETDKVGVTAEYNNAVQVDFENVFVASEKNTATEITAKLDQGMHVVLQPGNYKLESSIKVNQEGAVILGLGIATLISTNG